MKSWKQRWEAELDAKIPALRDDVMNEPIPQATHVEQVSFSSTSTPWYQKIYDALFSTRQRLVSSLSVCMVGLLVVGSSLYFALQPNKPLTAEAEIISVEVNPQAVFSVDKDGFVTAVVATNDEADIVLAEDRASLMEGKLVEEAVEIFVDYTARLGYIDLTNPDAVRISSCVKNGRLQTVGNTLKEYFRGMGSYVAVVEETMEMEAFCNRIEMDVSSSVETLKSSIERIPALSFERDVEGKEGEKLKEVYHENITEQELEQLFLSTVESGIERIEAFDEICDLSDEIIMHEDNPGVGFLGVNKDYWTIKTIEYPMSMSNLMVEMQSKLIDYEINYGVKLESVGDLIEERIQCSAAHLQTLTRFLLEYTLDVFEEQITIVVNILELLGIDTLGLQDIYNEPISEEEYLQKLDKYTSMQYKTLSNDAKDHYQAERDEISEEDYDQYVQDVIAEYGSLSAYYQARFENSN